MIDWNDLRYFLAVADGGSTLAAGRLLGVSQTTAARRIAALERELGVALFERRQSGYVLTPSGEAILPKAREMARAASSFSDAASAYLRDASGSVKLTTIDIYAVTILPEILRDLRAVYPSILIEVDGSDEVRDLAAGGADIALRKEGLDAGGGLVGRRVGSDSWTLYCSRDYAAQHGVPRKRAEFVHHPFIGGGGPYVWNPYRQWLQRHGLEEAVTVHHGSAPALLAAVKAGAGLAVLPSLVADRDHGPVRCVPPRREYAMPLWLYTHERLRRTPRIRAVLDFLAEWFRQNGNGASA